MVFEGSIMEYVSWSNRFKSYLIDLFINYTFVGLIYYIINQSVDLLEMMVYVRLFAIIYFPVLLYLNNGRTIGGLMFKIKVLQSDGRKLGLWKSFLRSTILFVSIAPRDSFYVATILFIIGSIRIRNKMPYSEKRQTLWDTYPRTIVVNDR